MSRRLTWTCKHEDMAWGLMSKLAQIMITNCQLWWKQYLMVILMQISKSWWIRPWLRWAFDLIIRGARVILCGRCVFSCFTYAKRDFTSHWHAKVVLRNFKGFKTWQMCARRAKRWHCENVRFAYAKTPKCHSRNRAWYVLHKTPICRFQKNDVVFLVGASLLNGNWSLEVPWGRGAAGG